MNGGGIYRISFKGTSKFYIGSTVSFIKRRSSHKRCLENKTHENAIMQNTYNKHGEFEFEVLESIERFDCPIYKSLLLAAEQYYIDTLNPYINILRIAGSGKGLIHTKETIIRIVKSRFTFDSVSREILWSIGDLEAGAGTSSPFKTLAFQVVLSPERW